MTVYQFRIDPSYIYCFLLPALCVNHVQCVFYCSEGSRPGLAYKGRQAGRGLGTTEPCRSPSLSGRVSIVWGHCHGRGNQLYGVYSPTKSRVVSEVPELVLRRRLSDAQGADARTCGPPAPYLQQCWRGQISPPLSSANCSFQCGSL